MVGLRCAKICRKRRRALPTDVMLVLVLVLVRVEVVELDK